MQVTYEVNKDILIQEALADIEINRSASPLYEQASKKTVFDHKDITEDKKKEEYKELKTRMVD